MTILTSTVLSWIMVAGALGGAPDGIRDAFPFFEPVQPTRAVQVMAHRGGMNQAPENTARALEFSIADGVEWVEVDVRITKDGHHVLFHDGSLEGKTNGSGPVRSHTLEEIRALDAGSHFARRFAGARILTLEEALELARGRVNLYLDLKDVDPARIAREVIMAKMTRQVVFYDKPEVLKAIRAGATEELAVMTKWRPAFGLTGWVDELRPAAVEIDAAEVTEEACREFHKRGIKVQAKVLGKDDRAEVWDRVVAAGVDWLQTDRAEEILARMALKTTHGRRPKVSHHRGAGRYAPENTMPAFEKSVELGADFVEFDVRTTKDGKFVLLHDGTLNRTTGVRAPVRDRTEAEVVGLDAGSWFGRPFQGTKVPGLDEFLKAVGSRTELYVDAKDITPKALAEVLSRHGLVERAVVYQNVQYLEELRRIEPRIRRMPPLRDATRLDAIVERVKPYAFDTQWSILSKDLIDRCHAKGVQVFSDALGQHETIEHYRRAIRDGIDLIQTDQPLRVLRAIELEAQAKPPVPVPVASGPSCDRVPRVRFALGSPVTGYLRAITENWLMPAPEANPAMLAMFRDRDRQPYRDLLPWSGEFAGKYLTGATQVLRLTGDPVLKRHLEGFVKELVALQDKDGYLGPFPSGHRLTGQAPNVGAKGGPTWDAWGHYHVMLGLLLWDEQEGDAAALAAASRIGDLLCNRFLGEKRPRLVDTGSTEMNLAPAHALCLLYRRTGTRRYLDLARQLVGEFAATDANGKPMAGDYFRSGLAGTPFYKTPKPRWESLHPILALAELHAITGEATYRTAFEKLWWSIVELDRHNNGGFSSGEQAQGNPYHRGAIETCCTIAWMAMSVDMLKMTGLSTIADELELSTLNSAIGMFSPTGRWSTYNTPMDGDRKANFHEIGFQCRPGSPELNCCSVNAVRGLGLIGEWGVMRDAAGLFVNWYGAGSITASMESGGSVTLRQETDYPRSGQVRIQVEPSQKGTFSLRLRIPYWSAKTSVKVNGDLVAGVVPGRYLALSREWKSGDTIELSLDFSPRYWVGERESAGLTSIYRGPILMTYDRRFNAIDSADLPALDAKGLDGKPVAWAGSMPPIVLLEYPAAGGRSLRLCDFASAGADGSSYRTWLKVEHAVTTPLPGFRRSASGTAESSK